MKCKKTKEQGPAFVGISKLLSEHSTFIHLILLITIGVKANSWLILKSGRQRGDGIRFILTTMTGSPVLTVFLIHLMLLRRWMFPINEKSSRGFSYTLSSEHVEELKANKDFMKDLKRGVELLMLSWGWDIQSEKLIDNPTRHQVWQDWPVPLPLGNLSTVSI